MLSDLLSLERRTFRYKREEKGNKRTGAMCDYQTNTNIDRSRNIRPNTQTSRKTNTTTNTTNTKQGKTRRRKGWGQCVTIRPGRY